MSWQRVMKERKENQRKRMTPSDLLGRELRRTTHIRSWYAQKGYKWIDIDPFYLDWLFSDEDRANVLSSPYFINKRFNQYIDYNTAGQQSVKIYIEGWAGTGKSTIAQEVSHETLDRGNGGKLHHVFGLEPFARVFEDDVIQPGDVIIADDIRYLEGEGSVKIVNRIANLANNLRFEEHHMIFVSSQALHAAKINPFCRLLVAGKLHNTKESIALVYLGDKLRGKIKLKIRDPAGFESQVLEAKKESMRIIKLSGGKATVELDKKMIPVETEVLNFKSENIRDFIISNCGDGTLMNILEAVFNGESQSSVGRRLKISQAAISERLKHFGESRLGHLVEEYFRNKTGDTRSIIGRAKATVPDVITKDGEIWSIKSSIRYRDSQLIYPIRDCSPELHEALKQGKKFTIVYINPLWGDVSLRQEIDPKMPPEWVSFFETGEVRTALG